MQQFHTAANVAQRRAILHTGKDLLVLAGPGSGKTFVITERIRYLIEVRHVLPAQIVTITFSKKAACEMQARFQRETAYRYPEAVFGTFHAFFYRLLQEGKGETLQLISEEEKIQLMQALLDAYNARVPKELRLPKELGVCREALHKIARRKEALTIRDKKQGKAKTDATEAFVDFVFPLYAKALRARRKVDFEDMIFLCCKELMENEGFLQRLQRRYRFFLVDEFQDISPMQYDVLRRLTGESGSLFAVGDDDQTIYAFRGADPSLMRDFCGKEGSVPVCHLNVNYRCRERIIRLSERLIRHNEDRFAKRMRAGRNDKRGLVRLTRFADEREETDALLRAVREEVSYEHRVAVIVRTNAERRRLEKALTDAHILKEEKRTVRVLTMHAAKGLEFDTVFLPGLTKHNVPSQQGILEEERRLLYVAMTRARFALYLSCVEGQESPFLREVFPALSLQRMFA